MRISLRTALAAEAHLAEGQLRSLRSTVNKVSEIFGQHNKADSFQKGMAEFWYTLIRKTCLGDASEQLRYEMSGNNNNNNNNNVGTSQVTP
jgi:hypothetical protein